MGKNLPPGSFSSPVRIDNLNIQEKGFGEMEKPVFISKSQKKIENKNGVPMLTTTLPISNNVVKASQLDASTIKANLQHLKANEKVKKLQTCTISYNNIYTNIKL